ncbi:8016_t:CDS:2 [Diversispora eburnea]|uniref:8016_t:CDS:1 n=1 Tax=Diversispora eburnea TaxID=1213867 RepID=A0A9N9B7F2_9GLOM|nr:8016_t:CDS:2 [Diversispora eburnea]
MSGVSDAGTSSLCETICSGVAGVILVIESFVSQCIEVPLPVRCTLICAEMSFVGVLSIRDRLTPEFISEGMGTCKFIGLCELLVSIPCEFCSLISETSHSSFVNLVSCSSKHTSF